MGPQSLFIEPVYLTIFRCKLFIAADLFNLIRIVGFSQRHFSSLFAMRISWRQTDHRAINQTNQKPIAWDHAHKGYALPKLYCRFLHFHRIPPSKNAKFPIREIGQDFKDGTPRWTSVWVLLKCQFGCRNLPSGYELNRTRVSTSVNKITSWKYEVIKYSSATMPWMCRLTSHLVRSILWRFRTNVRVLRQDSTLPLPPYATPPPPATLT